MWFYEDSGTFRSIKGPTRSPVVLPQDALLKLLIDGVHRAQAPIRQAWEREHEIMRRVREKVGNQVAEYIGKKDIAIRRLESLESAIASKESRLKDIERVCREKEDEAFTRGSARAKELERETAQEWAHLEEVLGMKGANRWSIHHAINNLRENLTADAEVARLTRLIADIGRSINSAASHPAQTVEAVKETQP